MRELERHHVGISEPDHGRAHRLSQRTAVGEVAVEELREMVVVVVNRVIDAVRLIESAERQVDRRDTRVLQEGRIVGARPQRTDSQVGP